MANDLNVRVRIGAALAPSIGSTFRKLETQGKQSGDNVQKRTQLGQTTKEAKAYDRTLARVGETQDRLRPDTVRLGRAVTEVRDSYREAAFEARRYSNQIGRLTGRQEALGRSSKKAAGQVGAVAAAQRSALVGGAVGAGAGAGALQSGIIQIAAPAIALAKPINDAIKFESVMASIRKVIDIDPVGLRKLGTEILKLSTDGGIPLVATQIGAIIAAAGRTGKVATKDLIVFAEQAAKVGVAFDLTGEEAGAAMTGLLSIFGRGIKGTFAIADAINVLDNNMDATARGILDVTNRIGPFLKVVGLSGEQTAALAATFIQLKTPPEQAATAMGAALRLLATADRQPKRFGDALQELGVDAQDLKASIKDDAEGALLAFLRTVSKSKDQVGVLTDLFGAEYAAQISKVVLGVDQYASAIDLVSDKTKTLGAVQKEFNNVSNTSGNRLTLVGNRARRLGIVFGEALTKPIVGVGGVLDGMLASLTTVIETFPFLSQVVGLSVASLIVWKATALTAAFIGPEFAKSIKFLGAAFQQLRPATIISTFELIKYNRVALISQARSGVVGRSVLGLVGSFRSLPSVAIMATTAFTFLTSTVFPALVVGIKAVGLAFVSNPIGLAVVALGALAFLIFRQWQPIKAFFTGVWAGIKEGLTPLMTELAPIITVFGQAWTILTAPIRLVWSGLKLLGSALGTLFGPIDSTKGQLEGVTSTGKKVGLVIGALISTFLKVTGITRLVGVFKLVSQGLGGLINVFSQLDPITAIQTSFTAVTTWLSGLSWVQFGLKLMGTLVEGVKGGAGALWGTVKGAFGRLGGLLPQSDAAEGPLSNLTKSGRSIVTTMGVGVRQVGDTPIRRPLGVAFRNAAALQAALLSGEAAGTRAGSAPFRDTRQPVAALPDGVLPNLGTRAALAARATGLPRVAPITVNINVGGIQVSATDETNAEALGQAVIDAVEAQFETTAQRMAATLRGALHDGNHDGPGDF